MLTAKKTGINFNPALTLPFLIIDTIIAAIIDVTVKLIKINVLKSLGAIILFPVNLNGSAVLTPEKLPKSIFPSTLDIIIIILWESA